MATATIEGIVMGRPEDLANELNVGHPTTGAYNDDDATAAIEVSALNIVRAKEADLIQSLEWAVGNDRLQTLRTAEESGSSNNIKTLAGVALLRIAINEPIPISIITDLIVAGILLQSDADALTNSTRETVSQVTALNLGVVRQGEVEEARALGR